MNLFEQEIYPIISPVMEKMGVSKSEIISKTRKRHIADCRFFCYTIIRECFPSLTLKKIGEIFSGRDHSSIHHGLAEAENLLSAHKYREVRELCELIINKNGSVLLKGGGDKLNIKRERIYFNHISVV